MFDLELPWWEFVVRGLAAYLLLLVMGRLSGRRTVGQFTPFDLLTRWCAAAACPRPTSRKPCAHTTARARK